MKDGTQLRVPIESFIIRQDKGSDLARVIYFDPRGIRHEKPIAQRILDEALAKLDGKPRAIRRSSGGITTAQPYQLVLFHTISDREDSTPELLVKVRFRDFKLNDGEFASTGQCMTLTKTVPIKDIVNPFTFTPEENQRFVLDFGKGIVPIHVFAFINDPNGERNAFFVEKKAIEFATRSAKGQKIAIQRYKVSRDVIRSTGGKETEDQNIKTDFDKARDNFERLLRARLEPIPHALKAGGLVEIPTGLSLARLQEELRSTVHRFNREEREESSIAERLNADDQCITSDVVLYMEPV